MPFSTDELTCTGPARFGGPVTLPPNTFGNANVNGNDPIDNAKLYQQRTDRYAQPHGTAAVTYRGPIKRCRATGTVIDVKAGLVVPNVGAATVAVDILKNGTSILSAPISIGVALAYAVSTGTVSVSALAANDVLEVSVTATAGGGTLGQGLFVEVASREQPG